MGAGPGDPKLLTVRALEVFRVVDVALYDRLVSSDVLELLPACVSKVNVGKPPHGGGLGQDAINRRLIQEAKAGRNILRLKGGDPLFFSRGVEEIEAISAEGIEYEIVPGVSSAIGVPSAAAIPLTRRGISSSVAILTGHEDQSKVRPSVDFQKLASTVDTIVVLMGLARLQLIAEQLVEGGAELETPVAIIESGTCSTQRIQFSTLGQILKEGKEGLKSGMQSPALLVIGKIVNTAIALAAGNHSDNNATQSNGLPQAPKLELGFPVTWCAAAEFA